jgi:hypothetical protein
MGWEKILLNPKTAGAVKKFFSKRKVSDTITSVTPTLTKGESTKVWSHKLRGKFKESLEKSTEGIDKVLTSTNKLLQKVEGKPITKSGISKGKDIKK